MVLKDFFTTETSKLFSNQRRSQTTPHTETSIYYDNDSEQVLGTGAHQNQETVPLTCHEQVPIVPDISSHQISTHNAQTGNSSFNSPVSEWASDFSKSSGRKRTYAEQITISRKISPGVSPAVSTGHREYGTWGGDTSSSDHDTIEVTQLASFTRKIRRKPKATNLNEEQDQNSAVCNSWQQDGYKSNFLSAAKQRQDTCSTQAVVPAVSSIILVHEHKLLLIFKQGKFRRSIEAKKRRILCDNNGKLSSAFALLECLHTTDAELLKISASIRQQQMNKKLK